MLPVSVLKGTGQLWEMFISITDWGWKSQALPYLWCHKSPGAAAESHTHLHPPNVNNQQDTKRWVIKITNIFQYNCDKHIFLYFLIFPWTMLLALAWLPLFPPFGLASGGKFSSCTFVFCLLSLLQNVKLQISVCQSFLCDSVAREHCSVQ